MKLLTSTASSKHTAEEGEAAVLVPSLVVCNPTTDMAMIAAPKAGADHRSVAACQQTAADDGGDDVLELQAGPWLACTVP